MISIPAEIKGTTIQSRLDFIERRFGEEARGRAIREMEAAAGNITTGLILPMSWYPLRYDDALCSFIAKEWGLSGESAFEELGRHSANEHQKFFSSLLNHSRTIPDILSLVPKIHESYSRNLGEMIFESTGDTGAILRIDGHGEIYRSICASNVSYIQETCRLITGRRIDAREPACVARGDTHCEYAFRWGP